MNSNRENSVPVDPDTETKSALKHGHDAASYQRRLRLRVMAKLMLLCAFVVVVYVALASFGTEDDVGSEGTALKVTLTDLEPGMMKSLVWESRPVLVYRRTVEEIAALDVAAVDDRGGVVDHGGRDGRSDRSDRSDRSGLDGRLRDPASKKSKQPEWARSAYRSREPEWFVAIALGTDLGCSLNFVPASESNFQGERWTGGFVDTCRKARYDLSGRVFKDQYATRNLVIPVYSIDGDELVLGRP